MTSIPFVYPNHFDAASGNETPASFVKRFREYDTYELDDIVFSRLVVESCISARLRVEVETRFSHMNDFDDLPGQVYFMLVLDTCHASAASDIEEAKDSFKSLQLASYAGENIAALSTAALKCIKIMQTGYALDYNLGTDLLSKVTSTSCEYFNRTIYSKFDEVSV